MGYTLVIIRIRFENLTYTFFISLILNQILFAFAFVKSIKIGRIGFYVKLRIPEHPAFSTGGGVGPFSNASSFELN
jgi:hypothetical protein